MSVARPLEALRPIAAAAVASLLATAPGLAQDMPLAGIIDEARIGFGYHNVYSGFIPSDTINWSFRQLEDLSFEVLFTSPEIDAFRWIGSPRPNLGVNVNLDGKESVAHLGLTWQFRPFEEVPVFFEGTLGAGLNNGYTVNAPPGFLNLGCNFQFYEQFGAGVDLSENVTAVLTYDHTSNAGLCARNDGLSTLQLKLGWRF